MGTTPDEMASMFAVMAAPMLVEAYGSKAETAALAPSGLAGSLPISAGLNARDASAA